MWNDVWILAAFIAWPLAVLFVALWLSVRAVAPRKWRLSDVEVDVWAHSRGLQLTPASREAVARRLGRNRLWRRIGALVPLWVLFIALVLADVAVFVVKELGLAEGAGIDAPGPWSWWGWVAIGGYFGGAVLAEATFRRSHASTVRTAVLGVRRPQQYLPAHLWRLLLALPAAAVVLVPVIALVPQEPAAEPVSRPLWSALMTAGAAVITAVIILALIRWLVARPQPVLSTEDAMVDDELRSSSVQLVAGAGCALLFFDVGNQLINLDAAGPVQPVGTVSTVAAVVCIITGLVVWLGVASLPRGRVRRVTTMQRPAPTVSAAG